MRSTNGTLRKSFKGVSLGFLLMTQGGGTLNIFEQRSDNKTSILGKLTFRRCIKWIGFRVGLKQKE